MQNVRRLLIFVFFILNFSFFIALPAHAQIPLSPIQPELQDEILGLGRQAAGAGLGQQALSDLDIRVYAMGIVRGALLFVGLIFIIMIVYAGVLWMTGGGSEERIEKAKKIITRSTIGVVLLLSSYAIALFIQRRIVRITFESALGQVQNCATAGGQASCCEEWAAFQNRITSFQGGLCAGATEWSQCGDQIGAEYSRCGGENPATTAGCGKEEYDAWRACQRRSRSAIGL